MPQKITVQDGDYEVISTTGDIRLTTASGNIVIDGSADTSLSHAGTSVATTTTAGAGGLTVNNTATGGGFERVLTVSDLTGGTPVDITVADEAADATSFISFFTAATGDLGPKTNAGLTFDASTGDLNSTLIAGITNTDLLDKSAVETISGVWTHSDILITDATDATAAGFRLPHGTAPSSPVDGDMWTTTSSIFARVNGVSEDLLSAGGTPTLITVADEAADATSFISFFTAATGDLGPKTNAGLTFDASTGDLNSTLIAGITNTDLLDKSAVETISGVWTHSAIIITDATDATASGLRLPHGTAPSSPVDGDFWTTTSSVFVRVSGSTQDLLAGGTPTIITVANEATDVTSFPAFFTAVTGDLGPKTNAGFTFNASTADLNSTLIAGIANANLVDKSAAETISGVWTHSDILITDASDTTSAGFRLPHGAAPTSPTDGDMWTTASSVFVRVSGVSEDLLSAGGTPTLITVADSTDTTSFPAFFESATGDLEPKTDASNYTYNATTGSLTAGSFIGSLTGNADTATTATNATNINVTDESADTTTNVVFVNAATGNQAPHTGTNLTFNSSTGNLSATQFGGINEANLLDKSATETVSGNWTFNGTLTAPEAAITAHEAALTILESQITDGSILARVASAETITTKWIHEIDSISTNVAIPALQVSATSTGTPLAGIGPSIEFKTETTAGSPGNQEIGATIAAEATDVGVGTEDFDFVFSTMAAGATAAERMRISSIGVVTASSFAGSLTGNADTATTATGATNINISATTSTDTTTFLVLVGADASGNQLPFIDNVNLSYNASTNALSTTTFIGALSGTATNATNINVTDESADTTTNVVFVNAATGNQAPHTGTNLTFNSSTGNLSATQFGGINEANLLDKTDNETISGSWTFNTLISGNITDAVNSELADVATTIDIATGGDVDTTMFPVLVGNVAGVGGQLPVIEENDLKFDALVGNLQALQFGGIDSANLLDKSATETISAQWIFDISANVIFDQVADFRGGIGARFVSPDRTKTSQFSMSDTSVLSVAGTAVTMQFSGVDIQMRDNINIFWGEGKDVDFNYDVTDFNSIFINTVDWNISGLTGRIAAGTVDADFDQLTATNLTGTNTGDEPAASLTVQGIVELATIAETNTGTDATRAVTPDGLNDWTGSTQFILAGVLIATSYGGITEANLLDKTATETITNVWTYQNRIDHTLTGGAAQDFLNWRDSTDSANLSLHYNGVDFEFRNATGGGGDRYIKFIGATAQERVELYFNNALKTAPYSQGLKVFADITVPTPPTTQGPQVKIQFRDLDDTDTVGHVGFAGTSNIVLKNFMRGGQLHLFGTDEAGTQRTFLNADPDAKTILNADTDLDLTVAISELALRAIANGPVTLYHNNSAKLATAIDGIDVTGDVGGTTIGGITEANLVDKTAAETISGVYSHTAALLTTASVAGAAGFRLPHGTAPTAPVNGDMWTTTSSVFVRVNGATEDLLSVGGTPTLITVANEATDTTSFPAFFTAVTGDLGPKTNAGFTFNASTANLNSTLIAGIANANLVDKSATESITGVWDFTGALSSLSLSVSAGINMVDTDISRPVIEDYAIKKHSEASSSGVLDLNMANGNSISHLFTEDVTSVTVTNPPANGRHGEIWLRLVQHASSPKTIAWPSKFHFPGAIDHVMSPGVNDVDIVHMVTIDGGTIYDCTFVQDMG